MDAEIPFLSNPKIHARVDAFRSGLEDDLLALPIDAVYIAEINLRLEPIPLNGLWKDLNIDAALAPDLRSFYVDAESYERILERVQKKHWLENRLRFSVAHEIGHFVLHGRILKGLKLGSVREYLDWRNSSKTVSSPEYQADEFAGRLLVPRETLLEEYDRIQASVAKEHENWRRKKGTREHVAKKLAPRFGVNHQVIETRLDREGVWLSE